MGIQVIRSGTNWTVDVTALGLVNDTVEKDFLVVINKVEQSLAAYVKTSATVITYSGAALPANTVIDFYRWGLRDVDQLEYGEVTSQLGMNRRLTQIERVLDDLREVKQFIWSGIDGTAAVATHVGQADPHTQYRLKSAAIPELVAHVADADPHPGYTTAAELTAALTGYLPTSQKGAINGLAPLDGTSKIPAINSRGCSAVYAAGTGIWTFTWPDNSTQTIDTPLELVFQSVNYNSTTKLVTFTLVGGATTSFSLADLVDLPEVQTNTANPSVAPSTGQKLYVRIDTGEMWVANGGVWIGPYLSFTAAERTKLGGVQAGATANSSDVALLSRSNHTGAQPISSVTNLQSTLDSKQPIDSDLTAIAGLPNADGLIRKTSDGNAVLQSISVTGAEVLGGSAAAGRAALDAASPLYVQSRGQNLVTNGAGLLGNNYNFSAATFDGADLFAGGGSFKCPATAYFSLVSEEFIPIDPTLEWQLSFYCKNGNTDSTGNSPGSLNYSGLVLYDSDLLAITPDDWMPKPGTSTTLAVALNPGATTITLTSAANWQNAGDIYGRGLRWWPYINSKGYSYPPYTYSRNNTRDSWAPGGITGNVVTLRVPWAGPALPAGTPVENSFLGDGSYKYTGLINSPIPAIWTKITGSLSGLDTGRVAGLKFPPGTAFAKIVFLVNYSPPNNGVIKFNMIALTAVGLAANILAGVFPELMRFNAGIGCNPIAASAAPANTVFVDAANGKLSFKDSGGIVNLLY